MISRILAVAVTTLSLSAFAQTSAQMPNGPVSGQKQPAQMKQPGQPGQMQPGQPGQMQPGQPGQKQPGQPGQMQQGQPGQPGQMPQGQMERKPADPKVCMAVSKKIKPLADKCLKAKDAGARRQCFDKIGGSIDKLTKGQSCDQLLEPMKQEYMAKEQAMYPGQPSAFGGEGQGPKGPQGPQGQPQAQPQGQVKPMGQNGDQANKILPMNPANPKLCAQIASKIKPKAESCLKVKVQASRAQCWEKLGQEIEKQSKGQQCDQVLDPMKQEYMAKEKAMYPNDEAGLK